MLKKIRIKIGILSLTLCLGLIISSSPNTVLSANSDQSDGVPLSGLQNGDKARSISESRKQKMSLSYRNTNIRAVMAMLSRKARVNILLSKDVQGDISINLYDVSLDQAVRLIASAAGYAVEQRHGSYFVVSRGEAGKYADGGITKLRTFKIQYTDTKDVAAIIKNHLSTYGKLTILPDRNLLVIEDTPEFLSLIDNLLVEIDKMPRQILIEAKILEILLNDSETFGVNWKRLFSGDSGSGSFGTRGFSTPGASGFFLELLSPNVELALNALNGEGRVHTLSTPKLLTLENQEASVVIGDRLGYRLTTTVNQVTTESIKFLEAGVILKVKASIDGLGQIMLDIHPEVSTGVVLDGIPSQSTTEVTTQLIVQNGQTVFIGGLIKRSASEGRFSIPVLGRIPLLGRLFSHDESSSVNTETIVMITPYIIDNHDTAWFEKQMAELKEAEGRLNQKAKQIDTKVENRNPFEAGSEQLEILGDEDKGARDYDMGWNVPDENDW